MVYNKEYWDIEKYNLLRTLILSKYDILSNSELKEFKSFYLKYINKIIKISDSKKEENKKYIKKSLKFKLILPKTNEIYEQIKKMTLKFYIDKNDIINIKDCYKIYINFLQKQNFNKIYKIKKFQIDLPIYEYKQQILYLLNTHRVIIIAGDTGCGKSTQVPQFLLHAGYVKIACTQPRRIACISLSKRVSYENLNEYNNDIAYHVRFDTNKIDNTKILFLTEGLLLRQFQVDSLLKQYNVIIIDEVHERHLNSDFLLGILKCLINKRDDLKIILMSATINANLFSNYFNGAPLIQVPGRLYPITLEYIPQFAKKDIIIKEKTNKFDPIPYVKVLEMIDQKYPLHQGGDLLIFLNGVKEINKLLDACIKYSETNKHWIILPLHSNLSLEEQDKVFDYAPQGTRKCVISTNIAETSLTIDGIRFVCDSGKVNEMIYNPSIKLRKLVEMWISKSSAEQRKGRAGRTGPGICYRMYSEADYNDFDDYPTPEIKRADLNCLILSMLSLGLDDPLKFPFIEQPEVNSMICAVKDLVLKKAINYDTNQITILGQALAMLPIEPSEGLILLYGCFLNIITPTLVYVASLSIQSPFNSSFRGKNQIRDKHLGEISVNFIHESEGDPFIIINAFSQWLAIKRSQKYKLSKIWCNKLGIIERRFYDMVQLCSQFKRILKSQSFIQYISTNNKASKLSKDEINQLKNTKNQILLAPKKRKYLNPDLNLINNDDDDISQLDVKEIEFLLNKSGSIVSDIPDHFSLHDHILYIFSISLGLYPQFAIPDDTNECRKDSEQFFHTKDKQFLSLHPNSFYGMYPEMLRNSLRVGKQPYLLAYVGLLETSKPYLLNTTLLLTCDIDTDSLCRRIIVDGWIELKFTYPQDALTLLCLSISIRNLFNQLIDHYFSLNIPQNNTDNDTNNDDVKVILYDELKSKLIDFFHRDIDSTIKYINNTDRQLIYRSPSDDPSIVPSDILMVLGDYDISNKIHPTKGGFIITPYITYGSLSSNTQDSFIDKPYLQSHFTCPTCKIHLICTSAEQISHTNSCQISLTSPSILTSNEQNIELIQSSETKINPNAISYICDICNQNLFLTRTEILIHIKSHDN